MSGLKFPIAEEKGKISFQTWNYEREKCIWSKIAD